MYNYYPYPFAPRISTSKVPAVGMVCDSRPLGVKQSAQNVKVQRNCVFSFKKKQRTWATFKDERKSIVGQQYQNSERNLLP